MFPSKCLVQLVNNTFSEIIKGVGMGMNIYLIVGGRKDLWVHEETTKTT